MSTWVAGKCLVLLTAIVLTIYPIQELTRLILTYQRSDVVPNLELFLMWWAYLSMPFILWAILEEMKRGKDE